MTEFISPRTKLFQHLDRLQSIKEGKKPAPVNVEIDLSNRCDLACAGCHFAYTHTRGPWAGKADKPEGYIAGGDLMDVDLALDTLEQLAYAGVKSITWTGGGEPTLHPRFDEIVRYAHRLGLEQGIYTHSGHVRGDRAAWMKEHFKWLYISFDAHDVDSYKAYKGVNRFERVCENVRQLTTLPGNATVGMGFLLSSDNYRQMYNMRQLAYSLGADYCQFRPTVHFDQHKPNALVEDIGWIDEAIQLLGQYKDDPFVIADVARFERYAQWRGHGYPTCYWAALQTVITPNGKVWRCTNKREHPDGLLGDLSVESFAEIWQRSGGSCAVTGTCRIACRGDISNLTLNQLYQETPHKNFI